MASVTSILTISKNSNTNHDNDDGESVCAVAAAAVKVLLGVAMLKLLYFSVVVAGVVQDGS